MAPKTFTQTFAVDVRLLRELGERLVGQPHIALAELIKNAYDADARRVEITIDEDRIVVSDDGHGMNETDFTERWMRIGTGRKEAARTSPELKRPMTGSKGIGRLAAQLLGSELEIVSIALVEQVKKRGPSLALCPPLQASLTWGSALSKKLRGQRTLPIEVDLESVPVSVTVGGRVSGGFPKDSACGTTIVITGLASKWDTTKVKNLAEELWMLQSPFAMEGGTDSGPSDFIVTLNGDLSEDFASQMHAIFEIWTAKITGVLLVTDKVRGRPDNRFRLPEDLPRQPGDPAPHEDPRHRFFSVEAPSHSDQRILRIKVTLRGSSVRTLDVVVPKCALDAMNFEIRVFTLKNRQGESIKVGDARKYLSRFGGVHIHDGGFRLPYYGPDQDWLHVEQDHAHRLSVSRLLPSGLQTKEGMLDLPTNSRLFGTVNVSTAGESSAVSGKKSGQVAEALTMQVTRDRLVDNAAMGQLTALVRTSLDLYAMEYAANKSRPEKAITSKPKPAEKVKDLRSELAASRGSMPAEVFKKLDAKAAAVDDEVESLEVRSRSHNALLGALATAGILTLAYEHETQKQFAILNSVAKRIDNLITSLPAKLRPDAELIASETRQVVTNSKNLRRVFSALLDEEARTLETELKVKEVVSTMARQLASLSRGTRVDMSGIPESLTFPLGTFPAWSAVVQNILINSFNAVLDQPQKRIVVSGGTHKSVQWVIFQDTGVGVDLGASDRYFEPFERGLPPSRERAELALGGTGLGLTIVRMIANDLNCSVHFVQPTDGFSTAIRIEWSSRAK